MTLNRFKSNKHSAMECSSLTASLWLNWHTQLTHTTRFGRTSESYCDRLSVRSCSFFLFYTSVFLSLQFHRITLLLLLLLLSATIFIIDFRNGQLKLLNSKMFDWKLIQKLILQHFLDNSHWKYWKYFWMVNSKGNSNCHKLITPFPSVM